MRITKGPSQLKLLGSTSIHGPILWARGAVEHWNFGAKIYSSCCWRGSQKRNPYENNFSGKVPTKYKKMLNQQGGQSGIVTHTHTLARDPTYSCLGSWSTGALEPKMPNASLRSAKNFMNLITEFFRCNYKILLAKSGIFISFSLKYFC